MEETADEKATASGKRVKSLVFTVLKIAIAVAGIWFVRNSVSWSDKGTLLAGTTVNTLTFLNDTEVTVVEQIGAGGAGGKGGVVRVRFPEKPVKVRLETATGLHEVEMVVKEDALIPGTQEPLNIAHEKGIPFSDLKPIEGDSKVADAQRIQEGMHTLLRRAESKWYLLLGAWAILGVPFLVTAIRWRNLMRPQGINMSLGKSLQLTFVGQFYSIMLPGITGGDLVKIVYASRLTGSKTKSFITVVLDRVIGLVALMVIAGTSAGVQLLVNARDGEPMDNTLLNVFLMIAVMLAALATGATVYFSRRLRRLVGIEWFVERFGRASEDAAAGGEGHAKLEHLFRVSNVLVLAGAVVGIGALTMLRWGVHSIWAERNMPLVVIGLCVLGAAALGAAGGLVLHEMLVERARPVMGKAVGALVRVDDTLHVYRGHFGLLFWAFVISLVSQMTLPLSAWLSGMAFGMNAPMTHYLAYVPVAVLAASMPISPPQGIGVFEWLLIHLFKKRGAFALAQAVRFLPIMWNLLGAYWVLTGKYSRKADMAPAEAGTV